MSLSYVQQKLWTEEEDKILQENIGKLTYRQIGEILDRSEESVRKHIKRMRKQERLEPLQFIESPYPRYDTPLVMDGDALVIPDLEIPFQSKDFVDRVLDLAQSWKITQCIVAGDLLHFDSVSTWEANWMEERKPSGGLSDDEERNLLDFAMELPGSKQEQLIDIVMSIGKKKEDGDPNLSQELVSARKCVKILSELFDNIDFILGNHEGRLIKALSSPMFPSEILRLIEAGDKWRIAPYYFSKLVSDGEVYQVEHPKSFAKNSPYKLASKYQCHILQAHAHRWGVDLDISGKFYAISMGCCVDEYRLPYAAQRHNSQDAHRLGAVIVRGGYPFLLSENSPWERLKRM